MLPRWLSVRDNRVLWSCTARIWAVFPSFRRNTLPPSSGQENTVIKCSVQIDRRSLRPKWGGEELRPNPDDEKRWTRNCTNGPFHGDGVNQKQFRLRGGEAAWDAAVGCRVATGMWKCRGMIRKSAEMCAEVELITQTTSCSCFLTRVTVPFLAYACVGTSVA